MADETLIMNSNAKQGLADMRILFTLLRAYKILDKVRPSPSI
jgi:histidyl-tRNA synthetase